MQAWDRAWGADAAGQGAVGEMLAALRARLRAVPWAQPRTVLQFIVTDLPDRRDHWLVHRSGTGLRRVLRHPGFEIDCYLRGPLAELRRLADGQIRLSRAEEADRLYLSGRAPVPGLLRAALGGK